MRVPGNAPTRESARPVLPAGNRSVPYGPELERAIDLRLGYAFDAAVIAMAFSSADGRFLRVNSAFCEMMGRTAEELLGMNGDDVTYAADRDLDRAAWQARFDDQENIRFERRFIRPGGTVFWGSVSVSIVLDGDGAGLGFFEQLVDVTEERVRQEALDESNERLEVLGRGTDDILIYRIRHLPELAVEFVSPSIFNLTGHRPEEFYARPELLAECLQPNEGMDADWASRSREEASGARTLQILHADGRPMWITAKNCVIVDRDGRVAAVEGIAYDVTARVRAENTLKENERRFECIVQTGTDLVCFVGRDRRISWVSPSVTRILGWNTAAFIGAMGGRGGHPDDMRALSRTMGGLAPGQQSPVEFRVRHATGAWRWLDGMVTNLLDEPSINAFVINVHDVTEGHELTEELERRANFDELTGLPNRLSFRDGLAVALASRSGAVEPLAVLYVALEGFNSIIEVFGYERADELLAHVALRLRGIVGADAVLARVGAEEFAVLVPNAEGGQATEIAQDLLGAFEEPFLAADDPFQLDANVGVAVYPGHGRDADILMRRAERARRAAQDRTQGVVVYSSRLESTTTEHISLLGNLRHAIGSGELELHYQPKLDLVTGTIYGVEALLRWHHPELGFVSPEQFIPLAERSGLIKPLTLWVIDAAMRQSYEWRQQDLDLDIAVNVTPRNLQDPLFPGQLATILETWEVARGRLSLELTERAVMTDPEAAADACQQIAESGVRLSLDDFGTGQSSFGYLASLPISELKVDLLFVRQMAADPQQTGIVRTIIDLAHSLGQTAIAEGVEDQATADLLARLGCDAIQGYLLSRPLSAEQFERWLCDGGWVTPMVGGQAGADTPSAGEAAPVAQPAPAGAGSSSARSARPGPAGAAGTPAVGTTARAGTERRPARRVGVITPLVKRRA